MQHFRLVAASQQPYNLLLPAAKGIAISSVDSQSALSVPFEHLAYLGLYLIYLAPGSSDDIAQAAQEGC